MAYVLNKIKYLMIYSETLFQLIAIVSKAYNNNIQ